ncbi:MAG: carbohydrate-binding family 9-like protein [Acidobacteria bacterium]|nr:carbohydrate-binding family 9-like protein [Acidobacteriota bacterium]
MKSALFFLAICGLWAQSRALGPVPRYEVRRAKWPIAIDGKLDDAAWRDARRIEFQFPWEQQTGAKQKTLARLLWDDRYLYAGYECEDTDIVAHYTTRDDPTYKDDAVEIFINPDPAQNNFYYGLEMNARAVLYDYFYVFPKLLLKRIDFTGVHLAVHRRGTLNQTGDVDEGWSLEVAIPWANFEELAKKLPPDPGSVWTANLNRWDGTEPNRRLSLWSDSGLDRPHPHNPDRFGQLVFVNYR